MNRRSESMKNNEALIKIKNSAVVGMDGEEQNS